MSELVWLKIDGVKTPTPKSFTPVYSDFDSDNSLRDETGYLSRECIRSSQVAPKFEWVINTKDLKKLLNMIKNEHLQVTFFDPMMLGDENGGMHTFDGYAQATRQPKLVLQKEKYEDCMWSFECSFIEY
jgi:hypothetical protein